jgi:4-hydroxy-2-oxoheptanedioate aldolase
MCVVERVKKSLADRSPVVWVNLQYPSIQLAEFLSLEGADVIFIDCEHGGPGIETVSNLAVATRAGGAASVVRPWSRDLDLLRRYIDCGIDGVLVPGVDGASAMEQAIRAIADTGASDMRPIIVAALVECVEGLNNLEAVASVAGVDGVLIGSADLAVSMGLGRKPNEASVREAALDAFRRCRDLGRSVGAPVERFGEEEFVANGGNIFNYSVAGLLKSALSQADRARLLTTR